MQYRLFSDIGLKHLCAGAFARLDRHVDLFFRNDAQLSDLFDHTFQFGHVRWRGLRGCQLVNPGDHVA